MNKPALKDYRLYLVTDPVLHAGYSVLEQVRLSLSGGVRIVQIREKENNARLFVNEAREALGLIRSAGAYLIINDRVDLALASDADGVHLGNEDLDPADARSLLGPEKIIGVSVQSVEEARTAVEAGADYLAVSGIFPTDTKKDLGDLPGLAGIKEIRGVSSLPLIAIGGIKIDNCADVITAGADGVAVVTGITMAKDIPRACRAFLDEIDRALRKENRLH